MILCHEISLNTAMMLIFVHEIDVGPPESKINEVNELTSKNYWHNTFNFKHQPFSLQGYSPDIMQLSKHLWLAELALKLPDGGIISILTVDLWIWQKIRVGFVSSADLFSSLWAVGHLCTDKLRPECKVIIIVKNFKNCNILLFALSRVRHSQGLLTYNKYVWLF